MNQNFAAFILGGTGQVAGAAVEELLAIPLKGQTDRVSEIDVRIAPKSGRHWRGNLVG